MSKKSDIVRGAGLLTGIFTGLVDEVRKCGGDDEDIHRLTTPEGRELLGEIAVLIVRAGQEVVRINMNSAVPFDRNKIRNGWTLESDVKVQDGEVNLELVSFLQEGEDHVSGEEMAKRAKEMDSLLGQRHAEALLENQKMIPEEWRKNVLVFPGTVWRGSDGRRYVPHLNWYDDCWCLYFRWLDYGFYSDYRLVRSRK